MVAAASLPPVQLALAKLLTRDLEGLAVDLDSVWAGPRGLDLGGLQVTGDGFSLAVEAVRIDLAFWSSIRHLRLEVESAHLAGVQLRASRTAAIADAAPAVEVPAATPAEPRPLFRGLAEHARLPRWLAVRAATAEGSAALVSNADVTLASDWTLTASGWAPDAAGTATLVALGSAQRPDETLAAVDLSVQATAEIGTSAALEGVLIEASLGTLDGQRGLGATARAAFAAGSERYDLTLVDVADTRLARIDAALGADGTIDASWTLDIPAGVVAAFARGRSLADLTATSTGQLRLEPAAQRSQFRTRTTIVGSGWEAFDPRLREWSTLTLTLDADAAIEPSRIIARAADLTISSEARGELINVDTVQALSFDTDTWLVDPEVWGEPAVRARFNDVPLRWLRHFDPSKQFSDGRLSFAVDVIRADERVTRLVTVEPLRAAGLELNPIEGIDVRAFEITLDPQVTLGNGTLDATIEPLTITADTGLEIEFRGAGHTSRTLWPEIDFDGSLTAHVPALKRIVPPLDRLRAATRLRFDFETLQLRIAAATAGANDADGREILAADLSGQSPLEIALPLLRPDWDTFDPQSVTLRLDRLPIDWLSPYIPELELRGGEISGRLTATAGVGQGLRLVASEPLEIEGFRPVYRGRVAEQTLAATLSPELVLNNTESTFVLEAIRLESPRGDALSGRISLRALANTDRIDLSVALDGTFPTLAQSSGARLGTMRLRQRGALRAATKQLDIDELELELSDARESVFLRLETIQPFFIRAEPFFVGAVASSGDVLRASVTPLELEQLLPRLFGFELEGLLPQGEFFGRVGGDGTLVIAADEPLQFRDVTVRWEDVTLLDRVTTSLRYEIAYSVGGVEARSVALNATASDGATMLHATSEVVAPLTAERTVTRASFDVEANLPALIGQPILADLPEFLAGTVETSIELVNDTESSVTLRASLRDAETERLGRLPDVDVGLDATGIRGERVAVTLPISLRSAELGASDLRFEGALNREGDGSRRFSAAISGARVALADLAKLAELLDSEASSSEPVEGPRSALAKLRTERHSVPIWTRDLIGTATLDLGQLLLSSFAIDGIRGRLDVSPTLLALSGIEASLLDAELAADARVGFDAANASPYTLELSARAGNFDLGRLFRAVRPAAAPTTEGLFDFSTHLTGVGRNPIDLGLSTLGEIRLSGRDGVFRGLAPIEGTGSTASRVIGVLTFSRELRALARLLEGLGEIRFEDASVVLARAAADRLELRSLSLRAPQVRLQASGDLAVALGRPLLLSPLDVTAELAARGDVAVLFEGMDLLEEEASQGYRPLLRPIELTGSPAEPDASSFWELLDEGAENARGSFGVGLRALNRRLERSDDDP